MSWDHGFPTAQELEDRFADFVVSQGGERVSDLFEKKHQLPLNADYLLWKRSVVAELKIMTADHFSDPNIERKFLKLTKRWVSAGLIPPPPPGSRVKVSTEGLPLKEQRKALDIVTKPLKRDAETASRQIRKTKEVLQLPSAKGLVLFANLADRTLQMKVVYDYLSYVLGQHTRSIHSFIFFSPMSDPRNPHTPLAVWMAGNTANPEGGLDTDRLNDLGHAWHEYINDGKKVSSVTLPASYLTGKK